MKAPDSLKILINDMLDNHWEDILRSNEFSDIQYDPSYNQTCRIKVQFNSENIKAPVDRYVIRLIMKYNME